MTLNVTEGDVRLRRPTTPVCLAGHVMATESFTVILALMMVPESMWLRLGMRLGLRVNVRGRVIDIVNGNGVRPCVGCRLERIGVDVGEVERRGSRSTT